MDQMPDGDRRAEIRQLWNVFSNLVIERELSFLREQHDARRGELLRNRRDVEDGARADGDIVIEVRHPVAALVDDAAVLHYCQRTSWRGGGIPSLEDSIHLPGHTGIGG